MNNKLTRISFLFTYLQRKYPHYLKELIYMHLEGKQTSTLGYWASSGQQDRVRGRSRVCWIGMVREGGLPPSTFSPRNALLRPILSPLLFSRLKLLNPKQQKALLPLSDTCYCSSFSLSMFFKIISICKWITNSWVKNLRCPSEANGSRNSKKKRTKEV